MKSSEANESLILSTDNIHFRSKLHCFVSCARTVCGLNMSEIVSDSLYLKVCKLLQIKSLFSPEISHIISIITLKSVIVQSSGADSHSCLSKKTQQSPSQHHM